MKDKDKSNMWLLIAAVFIASVFTQTVVLRSAQLEANRVIRAIEQHSCTELHRGTAE